MIHLSIVVAVIVFSTFCSFKGLNQRFTEVAKDEATLSNQKKFKKEFL